MSDYLGNLADLLYATGTVDSAAVASTSSSTSSTATTSSTTSSASLDFEDYLNLMCVSLQNQTIDDTADINDMMNQLVQMSVVSAISDIQTQISDAMTLINDATTLTYSASLVGKEVTIGIYDSDGTLQEFYGTVTATGALNGEQVIFLEDGNCYYLSSIMAIGRLPEDASTDAVEDSGSDVEQVDSTEESTEESVEETEEESESVDTAELISDAAEEAAGAEAAREDGGDTGEGIGSETLGNIVEAAGEAAIV